MSRSSFSLATICPARKSLFDAVSPHCSTCTPYSVASSTIRERFDCQGIFTNKVPTDAYRGAWTGPVYLLADSKVFSSAELFVATMRDNGVAKTIDLRLTTKHEDLPLAGAFTGFAVLLLVAGALLTVWRTGRLV